MQEDVYQGDGQNLYAYCGNNPVMYYDPSGYKKKPGCPPEAKNNGDGGEGKDTKLNRRQALNQAKEKANIPKSQQPNRQWTVGDDINRKNGNFKNYEYSDNETHHGRYYEYDTPNGKKVIVDHTNDTTQGLHTHAGKVPKGGNPTTYDFKNPDNRYAPIDKDTDHHIRYKNE